MLSVTIFICYSWVQIKSKYQTYNFQIMIVIRAAAFLFFNYQFIVSGSNFDV